MIMRRLLAIGATLFLLSLLSVAAQEKKEPLPRVLTASIPSYPPFALAARIQGIVTLRVSTDGKHVVTFNSEKGHPLLLQAAKDNVKTWEFEPHRPMSFDVTFDYRLSLPPPCETEFDPSDSQNTSVLLHLPMSVQLNSVMPRGCDPSVMIEEKK
jgi:hypothetical protein